MHREYQVGDEVNYNGGSGAILRKPGLGFVEKINDVSQWVFLRLNDGRRIGLCPESVETNLTLVTPAKQTPNSAQE